MSGSDVSGPFEGRVLGALRQAREQLEASERARREPIAIVGIGCRFPGEAHDPQAFWRLLTEGVDASCDFPSERFDWQRYYDPEPARPGRISFRRGAFLSQVDRFDAGYFGISPREARDLDPQHRLLLEVSSEALQRAALGPSELFGSRTGVFVGITQNDYGGQFSCYEDAARISTYSGTGNLFAFAAGRLSHSLGLRGPSLVVDTACSSSLVAVHLACQSLRSRESDVCIAGAAHLVLAPEVSIFLSQSRAVSPDGRCRPFDATANGFSRGEGCGVLVLRRLSDAIAERHHIVAVIRGSSVNHDGESGGLTVPSEAAQRQVVLQALENAGIDPARVGYVEAHGTGTRLGDPIEVSALRAALCEQRTGERRSGEQPLFIGSVKANIGHLEAAAGVAGLIKAALALEAGQLPPQINFHEPNPLIAWDDPPVRVATQLSAFPELGGERIAGVSAFGMSGTNAHAVLSAAPSVAEREGSGVEQRLEPLAYVLPLSARSVSALDALSARYARWLSRREAPELASFCYTVASGRAHFRQRRCLVARSASELTQGLQALVGGAERGGGAECFEGQSRSAPRVGLLVCELATRHVPIQLSVEPAPSLAFYPAYVRHFEATAAFGEGSISDAPLAHAFRHGLATVAFAQSLGVLPTAVSGVGSGKSLAAHVAGALSASNAFARASGGAWAGVAAAPPRLPLVGCEGPWPGEPTGEPLVESDPSALERAVATLRAHGTPWVLLVGPGSLRLLGPDEPVRGLPEPEDGALSALRALGRLYAEGASIDWSALYAGSALRRLSLPTYPFERERYWVSPTRREPPLESAVPRADLAPAPEDSLLGRELSLPGSRERRFEARLSRERQAWLEQHVILGQVVAPGALFLATFLEAARVCLERRPFLLEDVRFVRALSLEGSSGVEVQVVVVPEGERLELRWMARALGAGPSAWQLHATARAAAESLPAQRPEEGTRRVGAPAASSAAAWAALRQRCRTGDAPARLYSALAGAGARLGPFFRWHAELSRDGFEVLCRLRPPDAAEAASTVAASRVGLLDSCFQLLAVPAPGEAPLRGVPAPICVRRLRVRELGFEREPMWCHVAERAREGFRLLSEDGEMLMDVEGVSFCALDPERGFAGIAPSPSAEASLAVDSASAPASSPGLFVAAWPERPVDAAPSGPRAWLLLSDTACRAEALVSALEARGERADVWSLHEPQPGALRQRLVAWLCERQNATLGVVFLSGLGSPQVEGRDAARGEGSLEAATERSCATALELIQTLAEPAAGLAPRLWVVTRGARAVTPGARLPGLARAALWGLVRSIPLEEARLRCATVDLDPDGHELGPSEAEALARELAQGGAESAVAFRGGARHVERLVTAPWPARPSPSSPSPGIHSDATYLITGGLRGLGLELAQSLVERGARHLVLVSRSGVSPEAEAVIARLRGQGVKLLCAALDVAEPRELAALLERSRRELPPLAGVFHAAGVLEDALLRTQSEAGLMRVLSPKLRGAWNLHQQTQGEALSCFVLFSSLASLCGSPGQGAYGAANAFLDALAHHRRAQGLCALSVNFGAFARVGMAARQTPNENARRARWGLRAMEPEAGLGALYPLLGSELTQVGVANLDLEAWLAESSPDRALSRCESLRPAPELTGTRSAPPPAGVASALDAGRAAPGPWLRELLCAPASTRSVRLLEHVRQRVAETLSMAAGDAVDAAVPLLELGMDSLMGVELANRLAADLGLRLPSTLIFDCPTAAALAAELEAQLGVAAAEPDDPSPRSATRATPLDAASRHAAARQHDSGPWPRADLEQLNDEQLGALVDEMVARRR